MSRNQQPFTPEQIDAVATALHMNRISALLLLRRELASKKALDHEAALLDNLPCEICGQVEQSPQHRGSGHTHIPAETPLGRAALLLNVANGTRVSGYIFATARMMLGSKNSFEIVDMDHQAALDHQRSLEVLAEADAVRADRWTRSTTFVGDSRHGLPGY